MNTVTVTVSGSTGAGKSTIARYIELLLLHEGLSVERMDDNGQGKQDMEPGVIENSSYCYNGMRKLGSKGTKVLVRTIQVVE